MTALVYLDALIQCLNLLHDNDGDGICDEEIMLGCTNDMACNYDEMANTDDGSCLVIGEACDDMDDMTIDDIVNDSCECVGTLMVLGHRLLGGNIDHGCQHRQ